MNTQYILIIVLMIDMYGILHINWYVSQFSSNKLFLACHTLLKHQPWITYVILLNCFQFFNFSNGEIVDACGVPVLPYKASESILNQLQNQGYMLAVASRFEHSFIRFSSRMANSYFRYIPTMWSLHLDLNWLIWIQICMQYINIINSIDLVYYIKTNI